VGPSHAHSQGDTCKTGAHRTGDLCAAQRYVTVLPGRDPRHRRTVSGDTDPIGGEAHSRPRRRPQMTAQAEGERWQAFPTQRGVRTQASSPSWSSHSLWSSPRSLSWSLAAIREGRRARRLRWHIRWRSRGRLRRARGIGTVGTARCAQALSRCSQRARLHVMARVVLRNTRVAESDHSCTERCPLRPVRTSAHRAAGR
jgi:hypothetical protein